MQIGLDIGYSHIKAISGNRRVILPSVVGTPDRARFSLNPNATSSIILTAPDHVQVGEEAVSQSRFLKRREDRGWIESDEWYHLFLAAISQITPASVELHIVTGLPVAFYDDRVIVRNRLLGRHRVQREGRPRQTLDVGHVWVIPQPFGTLLSICLDNHGAITDHAIAEGAIGVVDIGGKTTNLLAVNQLSEIGRETASANVGAWDAVRAMRNWLAEAENCPSLELRDHQVIDALITRQIKYYGQPVALDSALDDILRPLAEQVLAEATHLWNGGAGLDAILVSGGGALLLGPYIKSHFRHARVIEEPVFANAMGFWKFAQRKARK